MASYLEQLKASGSPEAYQKLLDLLAYNGVNDAGAQIFTRLDTSGLNVPKKIDVPPPTIIGYDDAGSPMYSGGGGQQRSVGTINGIPVTANYDAEGNLTGYSGDRSVRQFVSGNQSYTGLWDANGNPVPQGYSSGSGGFASGLISDLGPIAPLALAFALPGAGSALGAALGTSAAAGTALAGAGLGALQGGSGSDILKGAALGYAGGTLGSNVAGITDSAALGSAAGTTATGLLSGKDLGTSLTEGAFSGAGTGIAGALNAPSMSPTGANAPDNIDVGGGWNPAGDQAAIANPTSSSGANIPSGAITSLLKSIFKDSSSSGNGINMATNATTDNQNLGSLIGGLLGGAGGIMQNRSNVGALTDYANRITQAGQQAQQQTQFRPVGITNTFGTSQFTVDPTTGQMTSAGYSLSPQLQAYQDAIMGSNRQSLSDAAALQSLGRGYLAQSPEAAAQQWLQGQQKLLAPSREQSWANLANQDYNRGTMGLKVAQGGGLQAANPYAAALANAQAQQDLALAAQAQQQGQAQTKFGQGLLSSAFDPFTAGLTTAKTVEGLAQQPFGLSTDLAKLSQGAGYQAGRLGVDAATQAGKLFSQANATNTTADILGKLGTSTTAGNVLGSLFGNTGLGKSLASLLRGSNYDQILNQGASDWITANPDITPQSTFNGGGVDFLDPETRKLLGLD